MVIRLYMIVLVLVTLLNTLLDIIKGYDDFLFIFRIKGGVNVLVNKEIIYNILIVNLSDKLVVIEKGNLIVTLLEYKPEW